MMRSYLILLMVTVFVSCKTRYVAVPEYHTVYQTKTDSLVQRDSIWVIDSVMLFSKADTVYLEKYRTIYKDRWRARTHTDTIVKRDSIRVPYPVEKSLTKMEMLRMKLGSVAGIVIIAGIFVFILKLYSK